LPQDSPNPARRSPEAQIKNRRVLPNLEVFRRIVRGGTINGTAVRKGFATDPNVAPYVDDILAYLQARADGALNRDWPIKGD
jgi:hypothetical protein